MSSAAGFGVLLIAAGAGSWLWRAIFRPMAPCRWCRGKGKAGDRKRWRNLECKHCDKGERMTLGARIVRGQGRGWGKGR